ncbi:hypothetical protein [Streptomyces sp. HO565]|uniref:hypothetical protein n=1 Tax=Streptomyces sp. HO565 TaxID=2857489 RepID=UPI0038B45789
MATVWALRFLLGLSYRQAAEAVRYRIDVKYALAMDWIISASTTVSLFQPQVEA